MACPHLAYRNTDGTLEFDHDRAYCEVTESFVAPIRADICNDRHDWDHENYCEIYREHEGLDGYPAQEASK